MAEPHWISILAALTRRYPFYSGCGTFANHPLMNALAPGSGREPVWAKAPGGDVRADLSDYVGRAVYFFGDLDPKITWILGRLLGPGDQALDIGANIGVLSLWMSKLVGPQGSVHAFEPNPVLCQVLEDTFVHNRAMNVKLHRFGLGASDSQLQLHVPKGNFGGASFIRKTGEMAQLHTVPVRNLDEVIEQENISRISLLKIDVEGYELEVFKGARRVLEILRPAALLFEANEKTAPGQIAPVIQFLHQCEYEFVMIPRSLIRVRTKVVDLSRPATIKGHDLVAAPSGALFARLREKLAAA